jgi:hypothetical protein
MFEFKVPLERDLAGEMLVVYGENLIEALVSVAIQAVYRHRKVVYN